MCVLRAFLSLHFIELTLLEAHFRENSEKALE